MDRVADLAIFIAGDVPRLGDCLWSWAMIPVLATRAAEVAEICRRFHIRRLDVFGSAAREVDFLASSDIDLLVDYEPEHGSPSLKDFLALRSALADVLGRKVDLTMAGAVRNPYVRAEIERFRQPLHGA